MRRLAPDHAPHLAAVAGADHDRLRRQDPRVPPAQGREMEKSPLVDIIDDQTDLIEVRIQHHGKLRPAPPRDQEVPSTSVRISSAYGCTSGRSVSRASSSKPVTPNASDKRR